MCRKIDKDDDEEQESTKREKMYNQCKKGTWLVEITTEENQARRVFIMIMYDKY
jgi:hypothetical protein